MARVQKRPPTALDNHNSPHSHRESTSQSHKLGARSCRACHQRKVRCDRGVPCTNCSRCDINCVYPAKDKDAARKSTATLQSISNRLEQLEGLLSSLVEGSQATTGSGADHGDDYFRTRIRDQCHANAKALGTTNENSSGEHSCKSTWQLLLNDDQAAQSPKDSDIESLLQEVRPDFLEAVNFHFHQRS